MTASLILLPECAWHVSDQINTERKRWCEMVCTVETEEVEHSKSNNMTRT